MLSKTSIFAFFKHKFNHYGAVLPYNLAYQIKMDAGTETYLDKNPILVCDVGARGSAPEELFPFYRHIEYHAFDADEEECKRLNSVEWPYKKFQAFPYFIGGSSSKTTFRLYKEKGHSSVYRPDERYKNQFAGDYFDVEREVQVESTTLDAIYGEPSLVKPDFLKLDTQGNELAILQGAVSLLVSASLVEIEVEFTHIYDGQPLFGDVSKFMGEHGFELLYLNRVFGNRPRFTGHARGQIIFGDALFGRREDLANQMPLNRIIKYMLLLINYGHADLAFELLRLVPDTGRELPPLTRYFDTMQRGGKIKLRLIQKIDKLAYLYLCLRKNNRLGGDSDRSWPVR